MYVCPICESVNHATRHHCQNCGTTPSQYAILGIPERLIEHNGYMQFISVVVAHGAELSAKHHAARIYLRTVDLDYYAESN